MCSAVERDTKYVAASAAIVAATLMPGCGSSSPTPAAPTATAPPAGAATSLEIVGAATSRIVVGDTAQFTAMATMSLPPPGATARCKDKSWSFATNKTAACAANRRRERLGLSRPILRQLT